jgi:hypothetical protein
LLSQQSEAQQSLTAPQLPLHPQEPEASGAEDTGAETIGEGAVAGGNAAGLAPALTAVVNSTKTTFTGVFLRR